MPRLLSILSASVLAGCLCADQPIASHLFPAGGQRGTTVQFEAAGLNLNQECDFEILGVGVVGETKIRRRESRWFEGPLLPLPESQRQENYPKSMAASVQIDRKATIGDRFVLLRTSQGFTQPMRFVVGDLPEVVEEEKDDDSPATEVKWPVTINGRIFPREDIDVWGLRVPAEKLLRLSVDSERLGYPLEARVIVRDPAGLVVQEAIHQKGRDPELMVLTKQAGLYTVSITDTRGEGGPNFVYRLSIAEVDSTSGSAVNRTKDVRYRKIEASDDPIRGNVLLKGQTGWGIIDTPGKKERWSFQCRKGDPVEFKVKALSLGSSLLARLEIADLAGKKIAEMEAGNSEQGDPQLKFVPPADGVYLISIGDIFPKRGGSNFRYSLIVEDPKPDFDLTFSTAAYSLSRGATTPIKISVDRKGGFSGAIKLQIDGLPKGIQSPNAVEIAAGQNSVDVPISVSKDAPILPARISIFGHGLLPMTPFTALPMVISHRAVWKESSMVEHVRLMPTLGTPFKIKADYELKLIPRGTVYHRKFLIERLGYNGPIDVELADNQARHLQGVTGPKMTIPSGVTSFEYPLTLPPFMETGRTSRTCLMGTASIQDIDGSTHVVNYSSREQNDQIIAVVEPERLSIRVDRPTVRVEKSKSVELPVVVRRGVGLKGNVQVKATFDSSSLEVPTKQLASNEEQSTLRFSQAKPVTTTTPVRVLIRATISDENGRPVTAEQTIVVYLVP